MKDASTDVVSVGLRGHAQRFNVGLRSHHNWLELIRFCVVGGSGYVINVGLFTIAYKHVPYPIAFVFSFVVAATNNFIWNRVWTFRHSKDDSHMAMQGARFFAVSLLAATAGLLLLEVFVRAGIPKIPGEMLAVALVVPVSFLGNKHWSFR